MTAPSYAEETGTVWMAAIEAWSSGDLPLAFHLCQAAVVRGKDDAEVYRLMASIAIGLDRLDQARRYLGEAAARSSAPRTDRPRYLVIEPWGCGFWGEVDHVICQLAVAEITGRVPIINWGTHGAYAVPGCQNSWEAYFQQVSAAHLDDISSRTNDVFPPYRATDRNLRLTSLERGRPHDMRTSSLYALSAPEEIVIADGHTRMHDIVPWAQSMHWMASASVEEIYRRLCRNHLHLVPDLASEVERLASAILSRRPILGVHYRAQTQSKNNESFEHRTLSWEEYFPAIEQFLTLAPSATVFLMTDLRPCLDAFQARYGARLVVLDAQRLDHADQIEVRLKVDADLEAAARQVIIDVYLAARCDAFLGDGASGVSCAVGYLKEWPPGTYHLLRANVALTPGRIQV